MGRTTAREALKLGEVEAKGRNCRSRKRQGIERRPYRRAIGRSLEAIAGRLFVSSSDERFTSMSELMLCACWPSRQP